MVNALDLATDLNPRVGCRKPREMKLQLKLKVLEFSGTPNEPSVLAECFSFWNFSDNGLLLDPPMIPVPFPTIERPIKDPAWFLGIEPACR
jgi:hypothetical protein